MVMSSQSGLAAWMFSDRQMLWLPSLSMPT